jgi:CBS domain-containing protein
MERFAQTPELLPVVSRDDVRRLEGVITADDVTRSFRGRRADAAGAVSRRPEEPATPAQSGPRTGQQS